MKTSTKIITLCLLMAAPSLYAQIRAGGAFLKFLPGAKQQVNGVALVSDLDNVYTYWANPGMLGMGREFGWSASYSDWISDFRSTAIIIGKRLRFGNWQQNKLVLSFANMSLPEFDSTKDRMPAVTAGDYIIGLGFGTALPGYADRVTLGVHGKYLRSDLDRFSAETLAWDAGILYKSARHQMLAARIPFFQYWRFGFGVSAQNFGSPIKFVNEETPLPRIYRTGASIYLGSHGGTQMRFGIGYDATTDEQDAMNLAWEMSLGRAFSLQLGYSVDLNNSNLLKNYAIGASIGLDERLSSMKDKIIGRNYAGTLEMSGFESSDNQNIGHFANTRHYSASQFYTAPEVFDLQKPAFGTVLSVDSVNLNWATSFDRDIFDQVGYWVLVDRDSSKLVSALNSITKHEGVEENFANADRFKFNLYANTATDSRSVALSELKPGDYYWTVISYDLDQHFAFAEVHNGHISKFSIRLPDLELQHITLNCKPTPTAHIVLVNNGEVAANNFRLALYPVSADKGIQLTDKDAVITEEFTTAVGLDSTLSLLPGQLIEFTVPLDSPLTSTAFMAIADIDNRIHELDEDNNRKQNTLQCWTDVSIEKQEITGIIPRNFGDELTYNLHIKNEGLFEAHDIIVADTLSPFVQLKSFGNIPGTGSDILEWHIDYLAAGEEMTIEYTVKFPNPFEDLQFDFAKANLRPVSQEQLRQHLPYILKIFKERIEYNPYKSLEIQGHTDTRGPLELNQRLSENRANAVLNFLEMIDTSGRIGHWKNEGSLIAKGYGEIRPLDFAETEPAHQRNRRVFLDGELFMDINNVSIVSSTGDQNPDNNSSTFTIKIPPTTFVNFDFDKDKTGENTKIVLENYLDRYLPKLYADDANIFLIEGHTDSLGSLQYNLRLSQHRADFVKEYFAKFGVPLNRMQTKAIGPKQPIATNATPEGRYKNRRVEIKVTK
ncbi:MAG: OmpA family protein [Deferribacteres bacterium]|nr:OmpA family protein [Deferribacteres bacterium]